MEHCIDFSSIEPYYIAWKFSPLENHFEYKLHDNCYWRNKQFSESLQWFHFECGNTCWIIWLSFGVVLSIHQKDYLFTEANDYAIQWTKILFLWFHLYQLNKWFTNESYIKCTIVLMPATFFGGVMWTWVHYSNKLIVIIKMNYLLLKFIWICY